MIVTIEGWDHGSHFRIRVDSGIMFQKMSMPGFREWAKLFKRFGGAEQKEELLAELDWRIRTFTLPEEYQEWEYHLSRLERGWTCFTEEARQQEMEKLRKKMNRAMKPLERMKEMQKVLVS